MDDHDTEDKIVQATQGQKPVEPGVDLGPNSAIGRRLKAYYDDVASEPVPDRFLSLLDALDAAEAAGNDDGRR
ncbi:NepR family anti-sigma factor [Aurantimonas sp. Leaf443]|uniref:NepR family anti-sigma factor n=1 Tax=Aurantimonas sp. Leaf443 TaxID=1736378 RepID=UPI000A8F2807|nr:NepR family anti-sigma factor [Aurantimonas sp. Leaf443]